MLPTLATHIFVRFVLEVGHAQIITKTTETILSLSLLIFLYNAINYLFFSEHNILTKEETIPKLGRDVIACSKAAFNFCCTYDDLDVTPTASYQKPAATARDTSCSLEEEQQIYAATNEPNAQFLKCCILTGGRPYSELAIVTADHVVETQHGMFYLFEARKSDGGHCHKAAKKTG
ncbi:hypothetical protein N9L06_04960, partial [Mariniblastus sp.]|nr:hypothetical protein [Mariniblastus sp.]